MNKNIKKAGAGLLLSALVISGASAWLSTSRTATTTNNITVGTFGIKFANQKDTIALTDTFPMTEEYAKQHLTPYTYSLTNKGDVPLDYYVAVDTDTLNMSFRPADIQMFTKDGIRNSLVNEKTDHFANGEVVEMEPRNIVAVGRLDAGQTATHDLTAYIDRYVDSVDDKTASFKLKAYAIQDTNGEAPFINKYIQGEITAAEPASLQAVGNAFNINQYYGSEHRYYKEYSLNSFEQNGEFYFGSIENKFAVNEENYSTIIQKLKDCGFTTVEKEDGTMKESLVHFVATNANGDKITFQHFGEDMVAPYVANLTLVVQK